MMEALMCTLGLMTHQIAILAEMSQARGCTVWPQDYVKDRPYKFALAVIGAMVGYIILYELEQLTMLTAFGIGAAANDSIDRAGSMSVSKIK